MGVRMCPLYPFHVIILYLCLLLPLLFAIVEGADELAGLKVPKWNVSFLPSKVEKLQEKNFTEVKFTCQSCPLTDHDPGSLQLLLKNDQPDIAAIEFEGDQKDDEILLNLSDIGFKRDANDWNFLFNITGKFLGFTKVKAEIRNSNKVLTESVLNVSIVRKKTIQSKVFAYSVAILVSLAYINMGCAMDMEVVKKNHQETHWSCHWICLPICRYAVDCLRVGIHIWHWHGGRFPNSIKTGPVCYRNFSWRRCFQHMDRDVWWKFGPLGHHDGCVNIFSIRHDAFLDFHLRFHHFQRWQHCHSLQKDLHLCWIFDRSTVHRLGHCKVVAQSLQLPRPHPETHGLVPDPFHYHIWCLGQLVHLQNDDLAGVLD